jgi:Tetratricopeptide repeat
VARLEAILSTDDSELMRSQQTLAIAHRPAGLLDRSILMFEEMLRGQKAKLGADHPDTLRTRTNLGDNYIGADRTSEALSRFERTRRPMESRFGPRVTPRLLRSYAVSLAQGRTSVEGEAADHQRDNRHSFSFFAAVPY